MPSKKLAIRETVARDRGYRCVMAGAVSGRSQLPRNAIYGADQDRRTAPGSAHRADEISFEEFFSTQNEILPGNKVADLQIIRMQRIIAIGAARNPRGRHQSR